MLTKGVREEKNGRQKGFLHHLLEKGEETSSKSRAIFFNLTLTFFLIIQVTRNSIKLRRKEADSKRHSCANSTFGGKTRKQVKSILHQEVSEFAPSGQMSMEQLIKVVLNLQEEVKKLHKENVKLTELIQHRLQDELDLRMANQERELDALWNYQRDQNSQTRSQMQQIQDQNSQMQFIFANQRQPEQKMEIQELTQDQTNIKSSEKQNKIKRKCFYCFKSGHKFKQCKKFHQFKRNYRIKEKKEREKLLCNQEGEIYRIKENQKFKRMRHTRSKRRRLPDSEQDFSNLQTYFKRQ